jgi:hypothetical protein
VKVRDSIGHAGDKMATPEQFDQHSFTGGVDSQFVKAGNITRLTMTDCLDDRRFTNTWEGKVYAYEISDRTLGHLIDAKNRTWDAFRAAAEEIRKAAFAARSDLSLGNTLFRQDKLDDAAESRRTIEISPASRGPWPRSHL